MKEAYSFFLFIFAIITLMRTNGKILFFNENEGKGILITSAKEKIDFFIKDWDDFDVMPSLGLEVYFTLQENKPSQIISKTTYEQQEENPNPQEIIEQEIQKSISYEEREPEEREPEEREPEEKEPEEKEPEEREPEEREPEEREPEEREPEEREPEEREPEEREPESSIEENSDLSTAAFEQNVEEESEETQEEPETRPESITISINIATAVSNYFNIIKDSIQRRNIYKKVEGKLDYILIKRFLFTTFNNLSDIDLHIITPPIKALYEDLKYMSSIYDDFSQKIRYPNLAYHEVFLSCQAEYMKIKTGAENTIERLKKLQSNEEQLENILKVKKEELEKDIKSDEFSALQNELKSLSGAYVDTVHLMAELDERYKSDLKLLSTFEAEYKADFREIFNTEALFYKKDLLKILDAQAYLLDSQLWQQAKKSKAVKAHFKESSINSELNTKTYLKYYLDTLNADKITDETKKLFTLYDYLSSIQKDYIVIVMSSAQDSIEYESCIKSMKLEYDVKAFVDEKSAIKWAVKNSVKILVVEDELQNINIEKFLAAYKKHVSIAPKIVLMGNKPKINSYQISSLLPRNASSKLLKQSIQSILNTQKREKQPG